MYHTSEIVCHILIWVGQAGPPEDFLDLGAKQNRTTSRKQCVDLKKIVKTWAWYTENFLIPHLRNFEEVLGKLLLLVKKYCIVSVI